MSREDSICSSVTGMNSKSSLGAQTGSRVRDLTDDFSFLSGSHVSENFKYGDGLMKPSVGIPLQPFSCTVTAREEASKSGWAWSRGWFSSEGCLASLLEQQH
eukprot:CAMPEP_0118635094 /NCGR_PEP_ID=MMETSP0785-20121206/1894_1 /TAXON_ID=91992 /ORGANISM="Bolidomonas pacifica, Strain CCMP 1866" /LENGTH=101 /DNA_ID=CAMNT_0006526107 /DNA_START=482 /DNA_END=784 /DNA_ORIENTATION=+